MASIVHAQDLQTIEQFPATPHNDASSTASGSSPVDSNRTAVASETPKVNSLAKRIHGWSWQAFPIGMGTSVVFLTFSGCKEHLQVINTLSTIFFFLTIVIVCLNTLTLTLQAIPWRLMKDPKRGIFVPLIVLSFAGIIIGVIKYGIPKYGFNLESAYVLFWAYVAFSIVTCIPMLCIWFNQPHELAEFTPAYAFLIFPMMLVGLMAFNTLEVIDHTETRNIGILLTGYFFQGLGFFMTFFYICIYILRILMTGFLEGHQANGAFIACGPPGFTALATIKLGEHARTILPQHQLISTNAGEIWFAGSVMGGVMLFGLAVFFFIFGACPYWFKVYRRLHEILGCWALTFPNVGWILALRVPGDLFHLQAFKVLHLICCCLLTATWAILFTLTIVAFFKGFIFNSNDEDVVKDALYYLDFRKPKESSTSDNDLII
ncbi:hypothetical protein FA15DRAFT_635310 [Coprinopsis marcescibilis]|uniref:Uncharacterized protein n=1 Tax=Coprinopsis marcescibilis TaxID=230819 RepID=A0A5C3L3U3_COPMA|nr:hypothetical protein FA15DRAFT_635310 [Coprinopsis marcescibilis]